MRVFAVAALLCLVLAGCNAGDSTAPNLSASAPVALTQPVLTAPQVSARAYADIVVDAKTGKVLHATDAQALRYPASLTKMMTLYLLFEELDAGRMTPRTALAVSETAAARPPAKIGVKAGTTITVDAAARALAVRSANDVAVVVAEAIAGSEEAFAQRMTRKARSLGMSRTQFVNASGLPDERQVTTARDMAILGSALHGKFPRWFGYFSTREFRYNGRTWRNTNKLLTTVQGMNGIKTGYIRASGFNLCASVKRGRRHVIAVVIGGKTGRARNARMQALIEEHLPKASGGGLLGF